MEQLTIEELAPYLPYGLMVVDKQTVGTDINGTFYVSPDNVTDVLLDGDKPLLRPLSQLTETIEHKGKKIVPIEWISTSNQDQRINLKNLSEGRTFRLEYWKVNRLLEIHFDIFGLLDRGLALPIPSINSKTDTI